MLLRHYWIFHQCGIIRFRKIIFPMIPNYPMDPMFGLPTWQPQVMPMNTMTLNNNFNNFNINAMGGGGGYPM